MIRECNSRLLLEVAERKTIFFVISKDPLREVMEFFKRNLGKTEAALARYYMLRMLNAEIVWRNENNEHIEESKQEISDPDDAPHLAAASKTESDLVLSTSLHFLRGISKIKVITPKQTTTQLRVTPYETDYQRPRT